MSVRDYSPWLRQAIAQARSAGLEPAASKLEDEAFAVFTTSSEMLEVQEMAIRRFLAGTRGRLPAAVRSRLDACLVEIDSVRPGWRGLLARCRRRWGASSQL